MLNTEEVLHKCLGKLQQLFNQIVLDDIGHLWQNQIQKGTVVEKHCVRYSNVKNFTLLKNCA
jgi:hypothetical protein